MRCRLFLGLLAVSAIVVAAFPALASAGTISGTVSAAGGPVLAGVRVCSHVDPYTFEDSCTTSDSAGGYSLSGLPAGKYAIQFDDSAQNRDWVSAYYGGDVTYPGTLVELASPDETRTGIDAQLAPGSTIAGAVSDAATHQPIAGIPVCAYATAPSGRLYGRCALSGAGGAYAINGLADGKYDVEFQSGTLNFQPQHYAGKVWPEAPTLVEVAGPGETLGAINAALLVGVEITGRVTEAGSGKPLAGTNVELLFVGREGNDLARTGADGSFRFLGQREGDYTVLFSGPDGPFGSDIDCYAAQYFNGSAAATTATVLHGVPGIPITGVDATLFNTCERRQQGEDPPVLQVTFTPSSTPVGDQRHKPLRCRKGFHRKRAKGKVRCVKTHRHRHRQRHHPPGAVASAGATEARASIYSPAP